MPTMYVSHCPMNSFQTSQSIGFGKSNKLDPVLNRKLEGIVERIFKSPFFWAVIASAAISVSITLFATTAAASSAFLNILIVNIVFNSVFGAGIGLFCGKKMWLEASLLAVRIEIIAMNALHFFASCCVEEREWYNEIALNAKEHAVKEQKGRVFLGAIPLATMNHHNKLLELAGGAHNLAVLSVIEPFENEESNLAGDPVRTCDWSEVGLAGFTQQHLQLPVADLTAPTFEQIRDGVNFIDESITSKDSVVYVHCKAGRGRSAVIIAAYMIKHVLVKKQGESAEDFVDKAIKMVTESRPQVTLLSSQRQQLISWCEKEKFCA